MSRTDITISYNLSEALHDCIALIAVLTGGGKMSKQEVTFSSLERFIYIVDYIEPMSGKRPIGMILSCTPELEKAIANASNRIGCSKSEIIARCIKAEVDGYIKRWECKTPEHLLKILRASHPLKEIEKLKQNNFASSDTSNVAA